MTPTKEVNFLSNNRMGYGWLMICLTLSLCTNLSISADDVFLCIDCGSSEPSKDVNLIAWVGDDNYVNTGESHSVKPNNSLSHVADTLRVFTTGKKNCYHIDSVVQGRVLLRASFYYGNYDGKSSPPTFALYFDGNDWAQVQTSNTQLIYYEVTYTMKKDSISVCVAQTKPEQFPFITALEVRSLESVMYSRVHESLPLFLWRRVAFGSNATIRYQDDPYDRLWAIGGLSNGSRLVSSDALFGERKLSIDRPPPAVLKHAMVAVSPNTSLELLMGFPNYNISAYMNFYFSEVTRLGPNQTRSFSVFMNNEPLSISFSPPYDTYIEYWVTNITVSLNTTFSLVSTNVSTLPPLINALEIFRVGDHQLTDGTNNNDVKGLAALQKSFSMLQSSSGDPCLPASYTWDWIQRNDDPSPRVTALLLGGYNLSGLLPDFSSMDALETIDLHNNSLRGPIPNFLGTLSNLRTLNLAKNQLSGTVPASLSTKKGLNLTVSGNPDLCTSNTTLKSCQILTTAPPPVNSSIKKKSNIVELLFAGVISSLIML